MSESMPPTGEGSNAGGPGFQSGGQPGFTPGGQAGFGHAGSGHAGHGHAGAAAPGAIPQDDKTIAVLTHLSGIIHLVIMPLIVWILKKDTSPYLNDQAKEALNFHISVLIYQAAYSALAFVTICIHQGMAFVLVPVLYAFQFVLAIVAAIAANKGEYYRYPMCLRFVK